MATKSEIARHLKVDPAAVSRWAKRGMPIHDLGLAVAWHGEHVRTRRGRKATAQPGAEQGDALAWRARLDRAKAMREEFALAREKGEFFAKGLVFATWQKGFAEVKTKLVAIPNAVGARLRPEALRDEVLLAVEEEIYERLLDISGTRGEVEAEEAEWRAEEEARQAKRAAMKAKAGNRRGNGSAVPNA